MCAISNRLRQKKRISHITADARDFLTARAVFSGGFGAGDRQDIGLAAEPKT
jgi:hypothetical protein